jgi:hypothetical protein
VAKFKWLIVVAILAVGIVSALSVQAEEESTQPGLAQRFKGKVVMVVLGSANSLDSQSSTEALENVAIEKIGDRYFMTGDIHLTSSELESPKSNWRQSASGGIAMENVYQYYVYSPEQYDKAMKALTDATED